MSYENLRLTKPTITAVNGVGFAGGWIIAQKCDLCVASTNALFAITEVKVGRGAPCSAPLIHMIPQPICMEIVLAGKPITAARACEIELVSRLCDRGEALASAVELAHEMLAGAPLSVAAARETVMLATETGLSAALDMACARHERANKSEDAREGPRAFAEQRKPEWKGK